MTPAATLRIPTRIAAIATHFVSSLLNSEKTPVTMFASPHGTARYRPNAEDRTLN